MSNNIPKLMTIRQVAKTGLIPEKALRELVKQGDSVVVVAKDTTMDRNDIKKISHLNLTELKVRSGLNWLNKVL